MAENIVGLKRTCMCAQLTERDIGKTVTLMGWCHRQRDLGGLVFLLLRDRAGDPAGRGRGDTSGRSREAIRTRSEFVLAASGVVARRAAPIRTCQPAGLKSRFASSVSFQSPRRLRFILKRTSKRMSRSGSSIDISTCGAPTCRAT